MLEGKGKKSGVGSEENSDNRSSGGESTARATLNYMTKDFHMEKLEVKYIITKYLHFLLGNLRLLLFEFIVSSFSCAIENGGFKRSLLNVFTNLIKHFI